MTSKFVGDIIVSKSGDGVNVAFNATSQGIPPKQEWHKHQIWQFNGKAYKPLTQKAEDSLDQAIRQIESFGYSKATKEARRKPTSIRYAVLTTGVEPFIYIK